MNIDPIAPRRCAERIDESITVGVVKECSCQSACRCSSSGICDKHRRNADAAGDQQMFRARGSDGEQIVRRGHRQGTARAHPLA